MDTVPVQAIPDAPLIEVSGAPEQRGQSYGEAARDRIAAGIGHYSEQLAKTKLTRGELGELVESFLPRIHAFDPTYVPEMRGIAAGANRPLADIVLLNARTEILKLGPKAAKAKGRDMEDDPDGCTGVVAMPGVTADGKLIHAQNWDWKVECAETSVVLKIRRDDGPDILTFTEAGQLARSGMNSAGIAITANYLECARDYHQIGVPLALIRRKVLQQATLALAMRAAYCTPKSASNNIIISQASGIAINFECAPDESFQVHPENGLIVHANHWISPVALGKLTDTGIETTPDSLYRDLRVRGLIAPHAGQVSLDTIKTALFDDYQSPWSVCRPPRLNLSSNLSATVAMVAMVPEDGIMDVAILPALNRKFTRYGLDMDDGIASHRRSNTPQISRKLRRVAP
jgi:isopenicillin-N N-acyltransferase like protein